MSEELSELDELIESDVLEALGEKVIEDDSSFEIDGIKIEDIETPSETTEEEEEIAEESLEEKTLNESDSEEGTQEEASEEITIEDIEPETPQVTVPETEEKVQTTKSTDLATLLSELLNNKTIEITIKIKD